MGSSRNRGVWLCFFVFLVLGIGPVSGYGQNFGEFFNQKKTQKRYLLQQIAALQVYLGYARKGYELVGSGLRTVKDFSNGEFFLHGAFISSLSAVSPVVRDHVRIAQIVAFQLEMLKGFNNLSLAERSFLSASNLEYLISVKATVLAECSADLQELILIVTPGLVEMSDHERLLRLDKLYLSMQDKASFTRAFCADVSALLGLRKREAGSLDFLNRVYEK